MSETFIAALYHNSVSIKFSHHYDTLLSIKQLFSFFSLVAVHSEYHKPNWTNDAQLRHRDAQLRHPPVYRLKIQLILSRLRAHIGAW